MKIKHRPIRSKDLTAEEIRAANEVRRLIPQAIVRWPKGVKNSAEIFPLGETDKETAAIVRKLRRIERKEES